MSWLLKAYEEKSPAAAQTKDALDEDSRALVTGGAYVASNPDAPSDRAHADLSPATPRQAR